MPHVDEGIPIITAKGVNRGRIDFEGADLTKKDAYVKLSEKDRPQPGDILITKDGTIGRAAVVDTDREFCINQSVAVIWLRSCPMDRKFLLTVIESELTQRPIWAKARGVAIQHLSITEFAKMALPIPPLAEQTRIVAEVERRLSVVEELEAVVPPTSSAPLVSANPSSKKPLPGS
jgi:type I restriction enzyme S subunit